VECSNRPLICDSARPSSLWEAEGRERERETETERMREVLTREGQSTNTNRGAERDSMHYGEHCMRRAKI
jgi:hypothetical protein